MTLLEFVRVTAENNNIHVAMNGMIPQSLTPQMLTVYGTREVKEVCAGPDRLLTVKIGSENAISYIPMGCSA